MPVVLFGFLLYSVRLFIIFLLPVENVFNYKPFFLQKKNFLIYSNILLRLNFLLPGK